MTQAAAAEHYTKLERLYLSSPTNEYYRPKIHIEEGTAHIEIDVRSELFHAAHAVHGSHYFKCLDDAAFFAVSSMVRDVFVLTANFTIDLMRPIDEGRMIAEGRVVSRSRRLFWAEATLRDAQGRQLARGSGTFLPSRIELCPAVGYR